MRVAGSIITEIGPHGSRTADCFTCQHCGCLVEVLVGQRPEDIGGYCRHCMNNKNPLAGLICPNCVTALAKADGVCFPFQKLMNDSTEREIERRRLRAGLACS